MNKYLLYYLRKVKSRWNLFWDYRSLRKKVIEKKGILGTVLGLSHPEFIEVGENVKIHNQFRIECYPSYLGKNHYPKFQIGDDVIIGPNFTCFCADSVIVGDRCIFAGNVTLVSENHGMDPENYPSYQSQELLTSPINIGSGCWFGQNVTVLPNVNIGEHCIIASNTVVSNDIPAYSIAAGCPAKVIKKYNFASHEWKRV